MPLPRFVAVVSEGVFFRLSVAILPARRRMPATLQVESLFGEPHRFRSRVNVRVCDVDELIAALQKAKAQALAVAGVAP